jgi:F-type H+-transporting ATPase subunit epsilon
MAQNLTLDILTPQGRVDLRVGEKPGDKSGGKGSIEAVSLIMVEGVELPAALGEMGVRPQHVPLLTPLVPGVVRFRVDGQDRRIAVGAGFVEISETGLVTLLTERAVRSWEVDTAAVGQQREEIARELQQQAGAAITDPTVLELSARRDWADAQLRAARA